MRMLNAQPAGLMRRNKVYLEINYIIKELQQAESCECHAISLWGKDHKAVGHLLMASLNIAYDSTQDLRISLAERMLRSPSCRTQESAGKL